MQCKVIKTPEGYQCQVCGYTSARRFYKNCKGEGNLDLGEVTMPPITRQAWNLALSLADFVADGCKLVTAEEYAARLAVCDLCEHRRETRCLKCGCNLALKARGRAFKCPEDKWSELGE